MGGHPKGLAKGRYAGFCLIQYYSSVIKLILQLLMFSTNRSPTIKNGGQKRHPSSTAGAHNIRLGLSYWWTPLHLGFSLNVLLPCYLAMEVGSNESTTTEIVRQIAGNFDCHADAAAWCGEHHLMDHIQGFTQSHWMPPLGKCLRLIASAAARVDKFVETIQTLTKHNF